MRLEFIADYLSIKRFDSAEIPDFTILTGVNGSGKTHLMQAIQHHRVSVAGIPANEISYFTYGTFQVPSNQAPNNQHTEQQINTIWQHLQGQQSGTGRINWINKLQEPYKQAFAHQENGRTVDLFAELFPGGINLWEYNREAVEIDEKLKPRLEQYFALVKQQVFDNPSFRKIPQYANVIKTLKVFGKPSHTITETDFRQLFIPSSNSRLLNSLLGVIFTRYKISQYLWAHREWEKGGQVTKVELYSRYEQIYRKPWDIVNEILNEIHTYSDHPSVFNFSITDPSKDSLELDTWQKYSFTPTLIDRNTGEPRSFHELSSGEQTLLALAFSIYESKDDFALPKLLLLDEIDASLHPSMTKALLSTLQKVFVNKGTKVILATHSPSTVALASKESVYVIHKDSRPQKIEQKSKKEALEMLTEGYATLETGLAIFNEISQHEICIMTEGNNCEFFKKMLRLFNQTDVGVVDSMKAVTGKDQLTTLFHLFCAAPITKPVLFIWDCDQEGKVRGLSRNNFIYPMALPKNVDNSLAPRGIENMFPENLFEGFVMEKIDSRGNITREFDPTRKKDFERRVLAQATVNDFERFQSVLDKLAEIRSEMKNPKATSA